MEHAEEISSRFELLSEKETVQRDRMVLKCGGVLGALGGIGYIITAIIHGDLPDQTTAVALEHIAGRPEWRFLKLAFIISVISWIGFFITMSYSLSHGVSWLLSRLSTAVLIIGTTLIIVEYSIIGYELKNIANNWEASSGSEREDLIIMAQTLIGISGGLFHSFVAWMIGLPYLLMGLAIISGGDFPGWSGWIAVIAGGGALLSGITRFLGIELIPYSLLFGGFVFPLNFWLVGMGIFLWYKSSRLKLLKK